MNQMSLKKKILLLVFCISMVCPIVAGIIIYRNGLADDQYNIIAERSLPRTRQMGEVLFGFRQVRIQYQSLAIRGNTQQDVDTYLQNIEKYQQEFLKSKEEMAAMMNHSEDERSMIKSMEESWKGFATFGDQILELQRKGDEESMAKLADIIRTKCPVISQNFEKSVQAMIDWQTSRAKTRTDEAKATSSRTNFISIGLALLGVVLAQIGGFIFGTSLIKTITDNVNQLGQSAFEINKKTNDVAQISATLSEAATQQASSLQETVASIDEISAMVARNSDSAQSSASTSECSTKAAQKGKEKVEEMMDSINAIASGNNEIIEQMQRSNKEISEIVSVIQEIAQKTQVINDIVFQTKLLSFNASVEAARAGEHGKGFAVVAEEVGNLASMSGKAATEITDMLSKSVKRVTDIVDGTKGLMESLIRQSKEKVDQGTNTAKECAHALDEILQNVSSVNEMVREISTASQEQSSGISEINKAMSELDHVTQQNTSSAQSSSQAATELNSQVDRLNAIVAELTRIVDGGEMKHTTKTMKSQPITTSQTSNVVQLRAVKKVTATSVPAPVKKAAGAESDAPMSNDPRFEDV